MDGLELHSPLPISAGTVIRFDFIGDLIAAAEVTRAAARQAVAATKPKKGAEASAEHLKARAELGQIDAQIERWQNAKERPVFLVEAPSERQRIDFEAAIEAEAHSPSDAEVSAALLREVRRLFGEGTAEYELVDAYAADPIGLPAPERERVNRLAVELRGRSPAVNAIFVARKTHNALTQFLLCKFFLKGWEGLPYEFAADRQGASDESLTLIRPYLETIGAKVASLLTVSGTLRKNLLSPSPKSSSPAN